MDRIEIRRYRPGDEHALADVFFRSVRGVGPADYTAAQVEAWAPARPDPAGYVDRATDGRALLVAVTAEDRIVGYADLQDSGHVDHLYCLPDHVGQGIGALLYAAIEDEARSRGIDRLFVEASEAARRLFERRGFRLVERRRVVRHGVELHQYRMEKQLRAT